MGFGFELLIIFALTLFNGVFAGAEIAMLSVRRTRLEELAQRGSASAKAALILRRQPERLLATVQVGITVIGATTAAFGGSRLEEPLAATLVSWGAGDWANELALVCVVSLVSYLSLVFGELLPKSLALRSGERFSLLVAPGLLVLARVSRPVVWALTASSNLVLRPFRDRTNFSESRLSADELQQLVEESAATGVLHPAAGDIASRAIDLGKLPVSGVMVPWHSVVSLRVDMSAEEVLKVLRTTPHARYPIMASDQSDDVVGYAIAREVYDVVAAGQRLDLSRLARPVRYFPHALKAVDVLRTLQANRQQLGLVVNTQGTLSGLLTIEDIAEELFGEILEENEVVRPFVWREGEEVHTVGNAPLRELERVLGEDVSNGARSTTVAGLLMERLGRIPTAGDKVTLTDAIEVEVTSATERTVLEAILHLRPKLQDAARAIDAIE